MTPPSPTKRFTSDRDAVRLQQIRDRDARAEGVFWYSVVTTGVYCRPTCPSRCARSDHIRFHDSLEEARRTGFRPCGRCRPEDPSLRERRLALVASACRRLAGEPVAPSGAELAKASGLSLSQFYRVFRSITGTTPAAWARRRRSPDVGGGRTASCSHR